MKIFDRFFRKQAKDCIIAAPQRAFCVRRNDMPAHPPVFSPFCRKWEREQLQGREEEKTAAWDELTRILSFADKREKQTRRSARRERRARVFSFAEEEFFPELLSLRGFNMEERGMLRGGREG